MERIGFIGVGSIGGAMARCVIKGGFKVTICDKSPKALEAFKDIAFQVTDKASDCAGQDMVIVMVVNDAQVNSVMLGKDGLLEAVDPKRPPLVAIMSTVMPQTTQALAPHCAKKNVRMIDATVSGLPVVAEKGQLTIMAGGEPADLEAMRPVLKTMGTNIFQTGALGSGNVTKLVNNIVGVTNLYLTVEAMVLAKKFGMDLHKLTAIMDTASGRNFSTKDWDQGKATFNFFGQTLDLAKVLVDLTRKDIQHAQEMAKQVGVPCPLVDHIVEAINNYTYEEVKERWGSV